MNTVTLSLQDLNIDRKKIKRQCFLVVQHNHYLAFRNFDLFVKTAPSILELDGTSFNLLIAKFLKILMDN